MLFDVFCEEVNILCLFKISSLVIFYDKFRRSLGRLEWRLSPSFQPHDRFLIPHNEKIEWGVEFILVILTQFNLHVFISPFHNEIDLIVNSFRSYYLSYYYLRFRALDRYI
ncbi:hypothetical protein BpHYR1_046734 [Brachionus plicatilis]|uniref:Uncharacterized protein n=1 Tax=Brachionus plicatilis TaxID=10195 RepID=A0A3M7SE92_BRAPC|nr:hypothetical protein BpHYR1_046734 [Brachionus plicatilis]